ncbi:metallophosphoesterase family protein [Paenibacillus motobuensis]|uniref:purple acid phosphatase family protein n=1 Tax=Paenibacillus TaxID=44249 RepID=UPI00203D3238|nr:MULTISPECIES: metallophosphoesterase family protein [Paenibacillus]MCM3042473.1 metallophosphoesterase family protein [Paenibacillus lutimineralis]MCM3649577.1 metallophosphoesterase family protein [Paenibacillus motobuensis]
MKKHIRDRWLLPAVCLLLLAGAIGMIRLEHVHAVQPKSLVTTFKGDPGTSRAFTWYTEDENPTALLQIAEGTNSSALREKDVPTYQAESAVIDIGGGERNSSHKVEVSGLKPGRTYIYRVGNGNKGGWSEAHTFTTEAANAEEFTFINVTDSQGITRTDFGLWGKILDSALSLFPQASFIIHNGDLTENAEDEQAWNDFFGAADKWVPSIPLMPVTGNHEQVDDDAARYLAHFNLKDQGAEGSLPGTVYSYDYGEAHFVVLNTESNIDEQTEWLREDLRRNERRWTIVAIHRPMYGGNRYKKIVAWSQVFDEYNVDLVLQGHNHEYSRSYPIKDGQIVEEGEGTVYVTTNASGQKFNEKKQDQFYHAVHFQNYKQMFAAITVTKSSLTYEAYDTEGQRLDEFELRQRR